MDEFFTRAQLAQLQVERLADKAKKTSDPDELVKIADEMEVILEGLRSIREEQLIAQLPKPPKRRWWQRKRPA